MLRFVIWPSAMFLGWTLTKLWALKYGSKSTDTIVSKIFMISVIVLKMWKHSDFHISLYQIEVTWRDFAVVTKLMKNFKSLYGFGGRCLKIRDVCMDFEPNFKVHNFVSIHPKSIKITVVKWPISTWSFMWWCQFVDWLKFETRPSSLLNFGTVYYDLCTTAKITK